MKTIRAKRWTDNRSNTLPFPYRSIAPVPFTATFFSIQEVEQAKMSDGTKAIIANMTPVKDIQNPNCDIAALVGYIDRDRKAGNADAMRHVAGITTGIYFWKNKFWTRAMAFDGSDWYRNAGKAGSYYALYEVEVQNADAVIGNCTTKYDL